MNMNYNLAGNHHTELLLEQSAFWLKVVNGWKREIGRVMEKSEEVKASPEITAEVAKTAGELSLFAENLDELCTQIGWHQLNLPVAENRDMEWKQTHLFLTERMSTEGEKFRNLLSEMFKLDKAAYKRFLC